jgi:glycosyltransferase involved in cell wall biosynthesis
MSPTISVIVTVYNRFELTKRAVESVLAQTLPVSEILIMDDGSFDGTSELLPQYIADNPAWRERVRYTHQENQGPGAARNNGIALASGEWLAFLDNDDLWLPQKLEWQFRALDQFKDQCGACISDAWFMNNSKMKMTLFQLAGKEHSESIGIIRDPLTYMLDTRSAVGGSHPVWLQNLVARTDLARRAGGFDPKLRFGDDDDFVFRLGCETKFCFVNMPMVLIDRTPPAERHVGANRRWDDEDFRLQMAQRRYEKRLGMSERLPVSVLKSIRRDLSAVHSGWANWFLQKREYGSARQAASDAVKMHFTPNLAIKWALARSVPQLARKMALMRDAYRRRRIYGIG